MTDNNTAAAAEITPREQVINEAYSDREVLLPVSGRVILVHGIPFGAYMRLSRVFAPVATAIGKLQVSASEATETPNAESLSQAVTQMMFEHLISNESVASHIIAAMTGLSLEDILALPSKDGVLLYEACVSKLDAEDISRFFAVGSKLTTGAVMGGTS